MPYQFGKYVLQRKLAEGGMAEVFLARQSGMEGFEKPVVIKRILPQLSGDPAFIDMFLNEARVAARFSHPALVQIFDFGQIDSQFYIAMEYIHGEDLRSLARAAERSGRRPSLGLVARVMADLLGGLHYAHTRVGSDGRRLGLVHRDVSPQNVLVTYDGAVKLVDFGIAKATQTQGAQQTQVGLLKGKYAYMSPEQCGGQRIDARSDVFAVGILLWELLTWKRLFRRATDLATVVAVTDEPIPRVGSLRTDVPPELERITARALLRRVDERYPTAQAMQADLEALIRQHGWEADSISLQRYMSDLFSDKLRLQDEAMRASGVGSIEDFLVRVDEDTRMAWVTGDEARTPSGLELPPATWGDASAPGSGVGGSLPVDIQPMPSRPVTGVAAPARPRRDLFTGSTLGHAVGQLVPRHPSGSYRTRARTSVGRRAAVVLGTSVLVAGSVLGAVFWPGGEGAVTPATGGSGGPAVSGVEDVAKVRVVLDRAAVVRIDGVAQPAAKETEVQVKARVSHQVRVEIEGRPAGPPLTLPPLEPGEVRTIRQRVGG